VPVTDAVTPVPPTREQCSAASAPESQDFTDRAVVDEGFQAADDGVAVHPHGFHQEAVVVAGQRDEFGGLAQVQRERLLAQHVAAGLQAEPGGVAVRGVRGGDVDDIDVRVLGERLPVAVRPGYPETLGERPRRRLGA
jgi:hypothetical protein